MNTSAPPQLIIYQPTRQPPLQRQLSRIATLVAWALYLYLWLPLATLALWWLGLRTGLRELQVVTAPVLAGVEVFKILAQAGTLAFVVLISWAEYNRRRFQKRERRLKRPDLSPSETAVALGVTPDVAESLQRARHAILVLDEHARPVEVRKPGAMTSS